MITAKSCNLVKVKDLVDVSLKLEEVNFELLNVDDLKAIKFKAKRIIGYFF